MRDDRQRLADILNAIDRILAKTSQGQAAFQADEMLQVWVLYHLQLIGEAARALSEDFRRRYPDKVWASAIGLRNILVHRYFGLDPDLIWKVVEQDLVPLRRKVEDAIAALDATGS